MLNIEHVNATVGSLPLPSSFIFSLIDGDDIIAGYLLTVLTLEY